MGEMLYGLAASLFRIAILLYVGLIAFGFFLSDRYIFLPRPSSYKDTPEFLKLTAEDGNKITSLYLPNPSAKFTLLISHGNSKIWEMIGTGMRTCEKRASMFSRTTTRATAPAKASPMRNALTRTRVRPTRT